jgi:hypothetical protein
MPRKTEAATDTLEDLKQKQQKLLECCNRFLQNSRNNLPKTKEELKQRNQEILEFLENFEKLNGHIMSESASGQITYIVCMKLVADNGRMRRVLKEHFNELDRSKKQVARAAGQRG